MFPEDVFDLVLEQLAKEVGLVASPRDPLCTDSYVARSVMQKAIRRGMEDLALRAAATLLAQDPRTMWRRLVVTALEDLGVGEFDLLARIVSAARDHRWRERLGGDWVVVSTLIRQACAGTRCQATNDLFNVAECAPELDAVKGGLCDAQIGDLLALITDDRQRLENRAVAVLLAMGESAGPCAPTHIVRDAGAVFEVFSRSGKHAHAVAVYQEAYRQSRITLAPLSLCLWSDSRLQAFAQTDAPTPPMEWIGDIPTLAYDQYVRAGRTAISRFVSGHPDWTRYATAWGVPRSDWTKAAGELLFRAEGAVVTGRRAWDLGQRLYARSATLGCFLPEAAIVAGLDVILGGMPSINQLRASAVRGV